MILRVAATEIDGLFMLMLKKMVWLEGRKVGSSNYILNTGLNTGLSKLRNFRKL